MWSLESFELGYRSSSKHLGNTRSCEMDVIRTAKRSVFEFVAIHEEYSEPHRCKMMRNENRPPKT
jgi:hypothetical protein